MLSSFFNFAEYFFVLLTQIIILNVSKINFRELFVFIPNMSKNSAPSIEKMKLA
jgi:hypothetical protein